MDMLFVGVLKCLSLPCFFACETQDFASLQADAIVVTDGKLHDGMLSKLK